MDEITMKLKPLFDELILQRELIESLYMTLEIKNKQIEELKW